MNSQQQEIFQFIRDSREANDFLTLQISQRFGIKTKEAKDAIEIVRSIRETNTTTTAPETGFSYQKRTSNHHSEFSRQGSNEGIKSKFSDATVCDRSAPVQDKQTLEKQLIKMKLETESKKLKKAGVDDFLESKKTQLVSFDKCIDPNIDGESYKSLSILAKKDRTFLLYYLYVGLDLDRITVIMNEHHCGNKKVKKIVDKLAKENHPIWVKYSKKHAIYKAYSEKVEDICEKQEDPTFLEKLLSVFSSDDKSSQKSSKNSSQKPSKDKKPHHSGNSGTNDVKIDLSKLKSEDDLIGKIGCFKYDSKNDQYVLKTSGSYSGTSKTYLRDVNKAKFEQILNGKPRPEKITGKIDWVKLSTNAIIVGAICSAK